MPRLRIIILDQDAGDTNTYRFVMWADVPAARQARYANATATSAWKEATAPDITALQNGSVAELSGSQRIPAGSSVTQIQNYLQARWQDYQNYVNNNNPWIRYGTTWDGTSWTMVTGG